MEQWIEAWPRLSEEVRKFIAILIRSESKNDGLAWIDESVACSGRRQLRALAASPVVVANASRQFLNA